MPNTSRTKQVASTAAAATAAATTATATADHDNVDVDDHHSMASLDIGACCICHSSLDYSDRAAFFREDRFEDYSNHNNNNNNNETSSTTSTTTSNSSSHKSYVFRPNDPYLPRQLYNPNNALVYCDSCDRLYHQQCHIVPLIVLPRGAWHCMYCQSQQQQKTTKNKSKTTKNSKNNNKNTKKGAKHNKKHDPLEQFWNQLSQNDISPDSLFASPPLATMRQMYEQAWFAAVSHKVAYATHALLVQKLPKAIRTQLGTFRLTQAALQTWTSTHKNRQHLLLLLDAAAAGAAAAGADGGGGGGTKRHGTSSQAVVDTLVQQAACQYKIQMWLQSVEQVRSDGGAGDAGTGCSSQQAFQLLVEWCRAYSTSVNQKNAALSQQQQQPQQEKVKTKGKTTKKRSQTKTNAVVAASSPSTTQQQQQQQQQQRQPPPQTQTYNTASDRLPDDFVQRVIFPFGIPSHTWFPPRTPEFSSFLEKATATMMATMTATGDGSDSKNDNDKKNPRAINYKGKNGDDDNNNNKDDDDDSGISLDGLTCCVCQTSDATDDNDLLLCDGHGCFRAYHMQCVYPAVTQQDLGNEEDDWFCPLCCGIADLIHLVQSEYLGDEWEQRRIVRKIEGHGKQKKKATKAKTPSTNTEDDDDDDSLQSWTRVDQVFPNSTWKYETALALQNGKQNADTNALLAQVFGWEMGDGEEEDDDDDVEEDEHFDLEAFHEERRRQRDHRDSGDGSNDNEEDDESSTPSSQATLVDMSSVELEINKDELAALSEADDTSSSEKEDESDNDGNHGARRSKRLRRQLQLRGESDDGDDSNRDPGKLDEANIIRGKRARKPVDYIKLNNAIFGDLSDGEAAKLDDVEDFQQSKRTPRSSENDDDNDDEEAEGDSNDDDDDDDDDNNELSRTSDSRDYDEKNDSGNSKDEEANKSKKKVSTKTVATRSREPSKPFTDNRLTKGTMNASKRVASKPSAPTRSSKRQKIQSKTAVNTSTKPNKTTNDVQRKESKNSERNARGTSIAQKALNLVSSWVSSPVRKAS